MLETAKDLLTEATHLARPFGAGAPDPGLVDPDAEFFDQEEDAYALTLTQEGQKVAGDLRESLARLCRSVDPFEDLELGNLLRVTSAALWRMEEGEFSDGEVTAAVSGLLEAALRRARASSAEDSTQAEGS